MSTKAMIKPMLTALRKGDLKSLRQLIDDGFPLDERLFESGNHSALHIAVDLGRQKVIELLLEAGADTDVKNDQFQEAPLHQACEAGDLKTVQLLVEAGADVDITNENGITPIMLAAEAPKQSKQMVEVLLNAGASIDPNQNGRNPLHSQMTDPVIVELLVEAGADVNGSFRGITPLMKSMENIFLCKVDPSSRSYNKPQPTVVAALMANGADSSSRFPREMRFGADAKDQSILEFARQKKLTAAILAVLESNGSSTGTKKPPAIKKRKVAKRKK